MKNTSCPSKSVLLSIPEVAWLLGVDTSRVCRVSGPGYCRLCGVGADYWFRHTHSLISPTAATPRIGRGPGAMNAVNPDDCFEIIAAKLDRFELVPDGVLWEIVTRDGACMALSGLDIDPPWIRDALTDRELAARICAHCPVRWECLELQLRTCGAHTLGVWGALPAQDVRALYPVWQSRRHRRGGQDEDHR